METTILQTGGSDLDAAPQAYIPAVHVLLALLVLLGLHVPRDHPAEIVREVPRCATLTAMMTIPFCASALTATKI